VPKGEKINQPNKDKLFNLFQGLSLDRKEYEENQKEETCPVRMEYSCETGNFPIR
jgi:hypothetical protein